MHDRPILILSYHIKLHTSVPIPWTTGWLIFKKESIIVWGRETVLYRISLNLTIYKSQKTVRRTKNYLSPSYHLAYTGIVNVLQQCIIYIFGTCCQFVVCDCVVKRDLISPLLTSHQWSPLSSLLWLPASTLTPLAWTERFSGRSICPIQIAITSH